MNKRIIPKVEGYTKIDVISYVQMMIGTNTSWAKNACLSIYSQQTELERRNHNNCDGRNNVGFGKLDAPILTGIACRLRQNRATLQDLELLQKKMPKYTRQLICIADAKDKCKKLKMHLDQYYHKKDIASPF